MSFSISDKLFKLLLAIGIVLLTTPAFAWWQPIAVPGDSVSGSSIPGSLSNISTVQSSELERRRYPLQRSGFWAQHSRIADRRIARWRAAVEAQRKTVESFARADAGISISLSGSSSDKVLANAPVPAQGESQDSMIQRMVQAQRKVAARAPLLLP